MIATGQTSAWSVVDDNYNTLIFSDVKFAPIVEVEEAPAEEARRSAAQKPRQQKPLPKLRRSRSGSSDGSSLLLFIAVATAVGVPAITTAASKKRK